MAENEDRRIIWEGKYLKLVVQGQWEYVERRNVTGIVCVVAVTEDNRLILVEQYRPPVGAQVLELPAGLVGDVPGQADEPLEDAARRELLEETGYRAGRMEKLFEGAPSAGLCDEHITFFLATRLQKVAAGGGEESEDITVHEVPMNEVLPWLLKRQREGAVIDAKIFSPLYVYRHRFRR